jgi:hypothetical protein
MYYLNQPVKKTLFVKIVNKISLGGRVVRQLIATQYNGSSNLSLSSNWRDTQVVKRAVY